MEEPADYGRRIAFFGGSFDPPHLGHIGVARAAQKALHLDTVLFAPVGIQPLKPRGAAASFADRVAMTELAIKGLPNFAICLADAPEPGGAPNYTIETLMHLRKQYPEATLFTLMGADSLLGLRRWHRGAEIPFVAPLIVASRPGQRLEDLAAIIPHGLSLTEDAASHYDAAEVSLRALTLRNTAGEATPFYLLSGLEFGISASGIRGEVPAALDRLCADGQVLPEAVCQYIAARGLYREGSDAA